MFDAADFLSTFRESKSSPSILHSGSRGTNNTLRCAVCGRSFTKATHLRVHSRSHSRLGAGARAIIGSISQPASGSTGDEGAGIWAREARRSGGGGAGEVVAVAADREPHALVDEYRYNHRDHAGAMHRYPGVAVPLADADALLNVSGDAQPAC